MYTDLDSTDKIFISRLMVLVNVHWGMEISRTEADSISLHSAMSPRTSGSSPDFNPPRSGIRTLRFPLTSTIYISIQCTCIIIIMHFDL